MKRITKEQLKKYLYDNWDATFKGIIKDLKITGEYFLWVRKLLKELEEEDWIIKSYCGEHNTYEYSPGDSQEIHSTTIYLK